MNNGNELAFPILETNSGANFHGGLTKREVFAMNAPPMPDWYDSNETSARKRFYAWPVFYADALLRELDK